MKREEVTIWKEKEKVTRLLARRTNPERRCKKNGAATVKGSKSNELGTKEQKKGGHGKEGEEMVGPRKGKGRDEMDGRASITPLKNFEKERPKGGVGGGDDVPQNGGNKEEKKTTLREGMGKYVRKGKKGRLCGGPRARTEEVTEEHEMI